MIQTGSTTQLGLYEFKGEVENAIKKFENTGGMISRATLSELNATTPEYDYQLARVDDTGDEYRWNPLATPSPAWEATGRNFLTESISYVDEKFTYFGGDSFTIQGFIDTSGNLVSHTGYRSTNFIKVTPSTVYTLKTYMGEGRFSISYFDESQNFISGVAGSQDVLSKQDYVTPINCFYIRCTGLILYGASTDDFYLKSSMYNVENIKKLLLSNHVDINSINVIYNGGNVEESLNEIIAKQNQIIADTNNLVDKLDLMDDKEQPFFIDTTEFVKSCVYPTYFDTVNVTSKNTAYVLTVSNSSAFVVNSACTIYDATADTYESNVVKSISGSQITFVKQVPTNPTSIQTMHDSAEGQHLNPFGYRGLADFILQQIQRYSYRKKENLLFDFHPYKHKTIAYDNPSLYDFNTGLTKLIDVSTSNVTFGGFVEGTTNLARFVGTDAQGSGSRNNVQLFSIAYQFIQGVQNAAFSMTAPTQSKSGFVHIPLSCDVVDYTASGGGSLKTSGRARLRVLNGLSVIHNQVYDVGIVHHIYVDYENAENLTIEVSLADNTPTVILLHGVYVYSKSDKTSTSNLLSNGDVVAFHGDSWTQYPIATTVGETGQVRPDGSVSDGAQYLSRRIKDKLAAEGISITTLNMGKGGQTTEWGKYWIQNTINLNPTHVVISFAINDQNSKDIADGYDFSPTDQWVNLPVASGGINGRVLTTEKYIENMKWICSRFLAAGIKPIVLLPPQTASFARTQGMRMTQLNQMYEGF